MSARTWRRAGNRPGAYREHRHGRTRNAYPGTLSGRTFAFLTAVSDTRPGTLSAVYETAVRNTPAASGNGVPALTVPPQETAINTPVLIGVNTLAGDSVSAEVTANHPPALTHPANEHRRCFRETPTAAALLYGCASRHASGNASGVSGYGVADLSGYTLGCGAGYGHAVARCASGTAGPRRIGSVR